MAKDNYFPYYNKDGEKVLKHYLGLYEWAKEEDREYLATQYNCLDKKIQDIEQREKNLDKREKELAVQTIDLQHWEERLAKAQKEFRDRLNAMEEDPKEVIDLLG